MRDKLQSISKRFRRNNDAGEQPPEGFPLAYEPQAHELQIIEHFTQGDTPLFSGPHKAVEPVNLMLCFTNRCGSNWLAALLEATGLIGLADEYFNAPRLIRSAKEAGVTSLNDAVKMQAMDSKLQKAGSFATKLSWDQLFFFGKTRIIPDMMPNAKYILMHRRDMGAQALSMQVAEQTGQWTSLFNSGKNGKRDLSKINDRQIQQSIDEIAFKYNQFYRYFGSFGITPVELYYEDLQQNPQQEIERLVQELGLNPTGRDWQLDESKVKLTKQADTQSQKRLEAFYQNMQNHSPELLKTDTEAA